jgi:hypothetical protein
MMGVHARKMKAISVGIYFMGNIVSSFNMLKIEGWVYGLYILVGAGIGLNIPTPISLS